MVITCRVALCNKISVDLNVAKRKYKSRSISYRYAIISCETWPRWKGDVCGGVRVIMNAVNMDPGEYQMGKTKVFIKTPESVLQHFFSYMRARLNSDIERVSNLMFDSAFLIGRNERTEI